MPSPCPEKKKLHQKNWYEKNKTQHIRNTSLRRETGRAELREWKKNYLKANPCVDCGEVDPVVLEFDHVHGKEFNISAATGRGYPLRRVIEEVKKCEVRCANCHRRVTHLRRISSSVGRARDS